MNASIETTLENLINRAVDDPLAVAVGVGALTGVLVIAALFVVWMILRQTDDKLTMDNIQKFIQYYNEPTRKLADELKRKNDIDERAIVLSTRQIAVREQELGLHRALYQNHMDTVIKLIDSSAVSAKDALAMQYEQQQALMTSMFSNAEKRIGDEFIKLFQQIQQMLQSISTHNTEAATRFDRGEERTNRILEAIHQIGLTLTVIMGLLTATKEEIEPPQAGEGQNTVPEAAEENSETTAPSGEVITPSQKESNGENHV
jgi:hypothetical protein